MSGLLRVARPGGATPLSLKGYPHPPASSGGANSIRAFVDGGGSITRHIPGRSRPARRRHGKGPAAVVAVGPQCVGAELEVLLWRGARAVPDPARLTDGQLVHVDLGQALGAAELPQPLVDLVGGALVG